MAKRLTDTDKWKNPWFRKLTPVQKCFWDYLLSSCDNSGIWLVDWELASFQIGDDLDPASLMEVFKKQIHVFSEGKRWFVIDFPRFQHGELKRTNNAHVSVINTLVRFGIWDLYLGKDVPITINLGAGQPLPSPCQGVQEEEEEECISSLGLKEKQIQGGVGENLNSGSRASDNLPPKPDIANQESVSPTPALPLVQKTSDQAYQLERELKSWRQTISREVLELRYPSVSFDAIIEGIIAQTKKSGILPENLDGLLEMRCQKAQARTAQKQDYDPDSQAGRILSLWMEKISNDTPRYRTFKNIKNCLKAHSAVDLCLSIKNYCEYLNEKREASPNYLAYKGSNFFGQDQYFEGYLPDAELRLKYRESIEAYLRRPHAVRDERDDATNISGPTGISVSGVGR